MNETSSNSGLPDSDGIGQSAADVDPRFDEAAAGTAPPRAEASSSDMKSAQQQFAEMTAACSEWVRGKPMQALALAIGVGFLLGRGGR